MNKVKLKVYEFVIFGIVNIYHTEVNYEQFDFWFTEMGLFVAPESENRDDMRLVDIIDCGEV